MKISVIIPTYNRLEKLKRVLQALENQSLALDQFEVVVVSDGSTDGTADYLNALQTPLQIQVVLQSNQGVAAARNHGILRSQAEIILFVDDDVIPEKTLVEEHLKVHAVEGDNAVVLGPMLTPSDYDMSPWVHWEQNMLQKQYEAMTTGRYEASCRQFFTGNSSLARCHLIEVGGFDPSFRRAEDVELAYRLEDLGLKFIFQPRAVGYHYAERSYPSWQAIPYVYGKNDVIFSQQKRHDWLLPTIYNEFYERHAFTRRLTRACLDRPLLSAVVIGILKFLALLFYRLGMKRMSLPACSAIFNLRYYQGVADQLGGKAALLAGFKNSTGLRPQSGMTA